MRTFGLIPAAGKSRRMGQPKLLLPLGERTVLACVLAAVRAGGVDDVLVVVGPGDTALQCAAEQAGGQILMLVEETADMRATCQHGLDAIAARWHPSSDDGWLLMPADHPTTRPEIVHAVLAAAQRRSHSIIVPTHAGRRGHPVWLSWRHVDALRKHPEAQGLNVFIRAHAAETHELPWPDADILRDLDTPEDYRRLLNDAGKAANQHTHSIHSNVLEGRAANERSGDAER